MTKFRFALLVVALVLAPRAASAGPIEWGYTADVVYAQDYGSKFTVTLAPGDTVFAEYGDTSHIPLFTSEGKPRPEPGSYEAEYLFDINVRLTDAASGQSAVLTFAGGYSSVWMYQPGDDPNIWRWEYESSMFGDFWDGREVVLGTTRYVVRAYGGGSGMFPFGDMDVRAELVPTSGVPEPGTLALAGIGLGAALLRARRLKTSRA
ncbi:PEP-CTERM sorting domain-containing protein [Gemmata sp.]|uniref:PEP-CTERM sorting domain-containing protein n=1 Tax=Gemmata sp. TaxID=1914242 RepID=UPI003F6F513D